MELNKKIVACCAVMQIQGNRRRRMSAEAGIRTRVLTLARLSDNQLHYFHSWLPHLLNGFKAFEGTPVHARVCQMPERQLWYRRRSLRTGSLVTLMPSFLRTDTSCG